MYITKFFKYITDTTICTGQINLNLVALSSYLINQKESVELSICKYISLWIKLIDNENIDTDEISLVNTKLENDNIGILIDESKNQIVYKGINIDFDQIKNSVYSQNKLFDSNIVYMEDEQEFDTEDFDLEKIPINFVNTKLSDCDSKLEIIKFTIGLIEKLGQSNNLKTVLKLKHTYLNQLVRKFKYLNFGKIGYNYRVLTWNFGPDLYSDKPTYRIRISDANSVYTGFFEKTVHNSNDELSEPEYKNYYYLDETEDDLLVDKFFNYLMDNTIW